MLHDPCFIFILMVITAQMIEAVGTQKSKLAKNGVTILLSLAVYAVGIDHYVSQDEFT